MLSRREVAITMIKFESIIICLVIIVSASSCSPNSVITGSWKNNITPYYGTILAAGITQSVEAKSMIEKDLATALESKGMIVTKSIDEFPPKISGNPTKDDMLDKIRKTNTDAILTVTLVDKQTQSRYVPGSVGYTPIPVYGRFGGYYNYWVPQMYSPNYYTQEKVYYMETNVYDSKTEELVWSAETETVNPSNLSGFSQELANIIANKLEKDGIIRVKKTVQSDKPTASRSK